MNPFDLHGPEFLLFYGIFAGIVIGFAAWFRMQKEGGRAPKIDLDPYVIAYLRGGINEVIRVAAVSLVDRRLLTADGTSLKRTSHANPASVRQPIEKWILIKTEHTVAASDLFASATDSSLSASFEAILREHGLLPDSAMNRNRLAVFSAALRYGEAAGNFPARLWSQRHRSAAYRGGVGGDAAGCGFCVAPCAGSLRTICGRLPVVLHPRH